MWNMNEPSGIQRRTMTSRNGRRICSVARCSSHDDGWISSPTSSHWCLPSTSSSASISVSRAPRFSSVKRSSSSISQYQSDDSSVSARKRASLSEIFAISASRSVTSQASPR